jgi:hypothetical protein
MKMICLGHFSDTGENMTRQMVVGIDCKEELLCSNIIYKYLGNVC